MTDEIFDIVLEIGGAVNSLEELQGHISFDECEEMVVLWPSWRLWS